MRIARPLVSRLFLPLLLLAAFTGCSTSGTSSGAPAASGSYTLTAMPPTLSLAPGGTGQVSLAVAATGGFSTPVAVSLSGLPAGVTASPSTFSVTPGSALGVTLTAASSASPGMATVTATGVAGTLSQTATVALTIQPPVTVTAPVPSFTLSVTPASLSLTAGAAAGQVSVLATAVNGFTGTVAVALSGLPAGVTAAPTSLTLTPGVAQTLSLTAAAAGTGTVLLTGTSGSLSAAASVALTVAAAPVPVAATGPDVTTYHYDNTRQGVNAQETILTLGNVSSASFGLLAKYGVDGVVDAAPLYLGGVKLGSGTANVLYVATEHDSVFAFNTANGAQVWKSSVLGAGETTSDPRNCGQIVPEIGITSTPVIDRAYGSNGAIFVIGMTKDGSGGYHHRLHALDLTTGAELPGSPTEITASFPGSGAGSQNGTVPFSPGQYAERVGLLLMNGTIYTAWTSHCDIAPYTGWVMGYSEATLKQSSVLNLTPNGSDGSVWMSGYGLAADTSGNIFLLDANGTWDNGFSTMGFPAKGDYGNAIVKLSTAGAGLAVSDFFEPYNTTAESDADVDLGSGGAMLLPDLTDAAGGTHHLLVGAGKDGAIYVGDRDDLGNFNSADNTNLYQEIPGALAKGAWSGPAYFNNTVFYAGQGDVLKAFSLVNAKLTPTPTSTSATTFGYPGATPSVSANGTGNGIVWAVESGTSTAAVLHAYDATNLAHELYNSNQAAGSRDAFGNGNKFITPVVANGRVYVGTPNGVAVFGLLGQ